ncbi:MAG: triose-phosphate isomerase [candidate division Zixibacteria bacterium]|nr:triose-phosphate isomerase [candidate division Zixibacteria bacterium]
MRRKIIAGNWKMNKTIVEAQALARAIKDKVGNVTAPVVLVCPPFTALTETAMLLKDSEIQLGGQNMHEAESGAFTGEISSEMLLTSGCAYVILGHSERREFFSESDKLVNAKTIKALEAGLIPIVCVGETLDQRESGDMKKVIEEQVTGSLDSLSESDMKKTVIAYEPVWAIGTGKTASPEQAEEVHVHIRTILAEKYGRETAEVVSILYGGSVKASNADGLFCKNNIDGALIGGASLKADEFSAVVNAMESAGG